MAKKNTAPAAEAATPDVAVTAVAEVAKPEPRKAAVKVDLSKYASKTAHSEKKTKYWVGVTADCPRKPVHVAGQDFPYTVTPPRDSGDGTTARETMFGQVVSLTDDQVEKIMEDVAVKTIRWNTTQTRGWLQDKRNVGYVQDAHDQPLAKYLYMIQVEDLMPPEFRRKPSSDTMA